MDSPIVSVIIPTYNHADYLTEAVQSVLDQTYPDFEVVIVNDGSTDNTPEVVQQFDDRRIEYLEQENRGATAARNAGIRASSGQFMALLDADDILHPEKLQVHVEFLERHPDVGASYNSRFEFASSSNEIRGLWRPPLVVGLSDLVLGFPFSPSDMVLRRDWAFQVDLFDESYTFYGDDLDFFCRLALAGCRFASVDRALTYRRRHSGRTIKNLPANVECALHPLDTAFSDRRCPAEVLALRDVAYANHYMSWVNWAFAQDETAFGQELVLKAVRLDPSVLEGQPCRLLASLVSFSIVDESKNSEALLRRMFDQLPRELAWLTEQRDWALAYGYLLKGVRAVMWGHCADGRDHFAQAQELGAQTDQPFLRRLTQELLDYEAEFGFKATQDVLQDLYPFIEVVGNRSSVRWLRGCYSVNRAFQHYYAGEYGKVPREVLRAVVDNPQYLENRGVIAILLRSTIGLVSRKTKPQSDSSERVELWEQSI